MMERWGTQRWGAIISFIPTAHYLLKIVIPVVMPNYCPASGPVLAFANSPSPQRFLYNITYFTCDIGFISSGGSVNPSFTCLPSNATSGTYSMITYSCERTVYSLYYYRIYYIYNGSNANVLFPV